MTKKEESPLPVFEAEIIDDEIDRYEDSNISQREKKLPLAYTLGKISGYVGTFLFGLLKSKNYFFKNKWTGKGGSGRRFRRKRGRK